MVECVFCKIISGKIVSHKIWENDEFLAFLDAYPNTEGMTILITKKHYSSYVFEMPNDVYEGLMRVAKIVAKLLDRKLKVKRTAMVMEGMGINHAHIKLYPLHGLNKKFKKMLAKDRIYFKKYEGYISTKMGPPANHDKLERTVRKIRE